MVNVQNNCTCVFKKYTIFLFKIVDPDTSVVPSLIQELCLCSDLYPCPCPVVSLLHFLVCGESPADPGQPFYPEVT